MQTYAFLIQNSSHCSQYKIITDYISIKLRISDRVTFAINEFEKIIRIII